MLCLVHYYSLSNFNLNGYTSIFCVQSWKTYLGSGSLGPVLAVQFWLCFVKCFFFIFFCPLVLSIYLCMEKLIWFRSWNVLSGFGSLGPLMMVQALALFCFYFEFSFIYIYMDILFCFCSWKVHPGIGTFLWCVFCWLHWECV